MGKSIATILVNVMLPNVDHILKNASLSSNLLNLDYRKKTNNSSKLLAPFLFAKNHPWQQALLKLFGKHWYGNN